jgi:hypothetical protein
MSESARERMLAGLPTTERRIELAGVSTALLEAGDRPSLVLLHGGIECGGAYWAPVINGSPRATASSSPTCRAWVSRRPWPT